jgi:hypothetical protein
MGIHTWPVIIINDMVFRGALDPETVFSAICSAYSTDHFFCEKHSKTTHIDSEVKTSTFVKIAIGLILLNIVLLLIYRIHARKELNKDMSFQVQSTVSQYMALKNRTSTQASR